jgi:dihydrolipoamide dehydrogenase
MSLPKNTAGITFLFKKNKIDSFQGVGSFVDKNTIKITKADGSTEQITGKNVIIATGSKPTSLPFLPVDKKESLPQPKHLT